MGLLKEILELTSEKGINDKKEVDTSDKLTSEENFDKFMKGKYDIEIPFLMKGIGEVKKDESEVLENKNVEENKEKIEEEKYLEEIFEGRKNEFNSIFSTINGTNTDESPEEKLKKFIWLNLYIENHYLDDNVGIEKNIKTEIYLTDEEKKNGVTKIIKYERNELISKYNYINDTEIMEMQTVECQKEIVIPPDIKEGTVYKFIGFGNCFEDVDEKIQCGDLYVFILGDDKDGNS